MQSKPRLVDLRGGRKIPPPAPGDIRPQAPRRSQLKQRKRRVRAVVTAAVCVCALLTAYALHAASYLPRFTYQHVTVTGAHSVASADVEKFVENKLGESSRGFVSGRNIFIYDYSSLSREIVDNFPTLKDAEVTRDAAIGNGLSVSVRERVPFAQWCEVGNPDCYLVDEDGVVFASAAGVATSSLPTPYVFSGVLSTSSVSTVNAPYGEVFAGTHFAGIKALLKMLHDSGVTPIAVRLENDSDFTISLAEGYYLKISFGGDASMLTKNLALILNADALHGKASLLEYIDLRFGNRVYYKFKGQAQSAQ